MYPDIKLRYGAGLIASPKPPPSVKAKVSSGSRVSEPAGGREPNPDLGGDGKP